MAECRFLPIEASLAENNVTIFSVDHGFLFMFDRHIRSILRRLWVISMFSMGQNGGILIHPLGCDPDRKCRRNSNFWSPVSICALWNFFYLLPFKSYFMFFIWLEIPLRVQKLGFTRLWTHYRNFVVMRPAKGISLPLDRFFWASGRPNRFTRAVYAGSNEKKNVT